jgi:hypothetical protein
MTELYSIEDTHDSLDYIGVDEVTIAYAQNGCVLSFWGRLGEEGVYKEFKIVYPSLEVAFDMVKDLSQ